MSSQSVVVRTARITRVLEVVQEGMPLLGLLLALLFMLDIFHLIYKTGIGSHIDSFLWYHWGHRGLSLSAAMVITVVNVSIIIVCGYAGIQCSRHMFLSALINVVQFRILFGSYPLRAKERAKVARLVLSQLAQRCLDESEKKAGVSKQDDPELYAAFNVFRRAVMYAGNNGCPVSHSGRIKDFVTA